MVNKYTQGDMAECGGPTPMPSRPAEDIVHRHLGTCTAEFDLELRAKGRGFRRIFGYRIATFPARATTHVGHGDYTPADLRHDLATALREAADALEADDEG